MEAKTWNKSVRPQSELVPVRRHSSVEINSLIASRERQFRQNNGMRQDRDREFSEVFPLLAEPLSNPMRRFAFLGLSF